jgi:hypothetical protein
MKGAFIADVESLLLNLTTDELLHLGVTAAFGNRCISCLVERCCVTVHSSRIIAWLEVMAIFMLHWAVGQMAKEWAIACHRSCDLTLHLGIRLMVIRAVIPVNEAMEIRQIADIEPLLCDLPPSKDRHLMVAAQ